MHFTYKLAIINSGINSIILHSGRLTKNISTGINYYLPHNHITLTDLFYKHITIVQ